MNKLRKLFIKCDACGKYSSTIVILPDGSSLCKNCREALRCLLSDKILKHLPESIEQV